MQVDKAEYNEQYNEELWNSRGLLYLICGKDFQVQQTAMTSILETSTSSCAKIRLIILIEDPAMSLWNPSQVLHPCCNAETADLNLFSIGLFANRFLC